MHVGNENKKKFPLAAFYISNIKNMKEFHDFCFFNQWISACLRLKPWDTKIIPTTVGNCKNKVNVVSLILMAENGSPKLEYSNKSNKYGRTYLNDSIFQRSFLPTLKTIPIQCRPSSYARDLLYLSSISISNILVLKMEFERDADLLEEAFFSGILF